MTLRPCPSCQRHDRDQEQACPIRAAACTPDRPKLSKRLALGGVMLLTACYGTPPIPAPGAPSGSERGDSARDDG